MTKEAALYSFFNSFDIPAYPDTAVPDETPLPFIVYQVITDGFDGEAVYPTATLWCRTDSEAEANAKVRTIYDAIGQTGKVLECDGGGIWIHHGSPWCRNIAGADSNVKGRYINLAIRYLTL